MYIKKHFFLLILILMIGFSACSIEEEAMSEEVHSSIHQRLTHWENDMEFFALYELRENSNVIEGELYVSQNHRPVTNLAGSVISRTSGSEDTRQQLSEQRNGIYPFELTFQDNESTELSIEVEIDGSQHHITMGSITRDVASNDNYNSEDVVELDKKMQWQMSMESSWVEYDEIPDIIRGMGKVRHDPTYYYEVTSPVDGHINTVDLNLIPASGVAVIAGDRLTAISPPLSSDNNSWTELRLGYVQAQEAYERAQRLIQNDAISLRDYQLRQREYEVRKAGYEHFMNNNNHGASIEDAGNYLYLRADQPGVISESYVVNGRQVKQGDPLFSIYNPDYVWLEVLGFRDELRTLAEITGVEVLINREAPITFHQEQISLVSRDLQSDPSGSRSKVILAINNRDGLLALNQPVQVRLRGNESNRVIAVPNEAIFDDDTHKVVFVKHSGDQFERRMVRTGGSYGGKTAVFEGLSEGEKIVTKGTYPLHLMTGNVQIDEDHDH